jgi:hypothetical protein
MGVVAVRSEGVNVDSKGFAVGVTLCFILIGVWAATVHILTKWNLSMLRRVPALSWETVGLVWSYAWTVTALTLLLLVTLTIILCLMECALKRSAES